MRKDRKTSSETVINIDNLKKWVRENRTIGGVIDELMPGEKNNKAKRATIIECTVVRQNKVKRRIQQS